MSNARAQSHTHEHQTALDADVGRPDSSAARVFPGTGYGQQRVEAGGQERPFKRQGRTTTGNAETAGACRALNTRPERLESGELPRSNGFGGAIKTPALPDNRVGVA